MARSTVVRQRTPADAVPPPVLLVGAVTSVQFGGALAKTLFDDLGPGGTVLLRVLFAALLLGALWRPRLGRHSRGELALAATFGVTLAGMNLAFYESLDRIPLGVAVTLEFVGPLSVAVAGSRRALDLLWVGLAATGILLLADFTGGADTAGILLALLAGSFWAAYILLAARIGRAFSGGSGLALAMVLAALLLVPAGVADGGDRLFDPGLVAIGAAVALLSSAIPYSLELEALRRLPSGVFGVLMSLEPAVAATAGFIVLGQVLGLRDVIAICLVVCASAGAARTARPGTPEPRD
jgi:inner membrane transporter RhtA